MGKYLAKTFTILAAVLFISFIVLEQNAQARAGSSNSSGSRGSRSYSKPANATSQPAGQQRQQAAPPPNTFQQQGGGFMRSMAGGMMGGMLGSMLFSSFAGASGAAGAAKAGGGIGIFEIILLAGGGYLIYRYMKRKQQESPSMAPAQGSFLSKLSTIIPISNTQQINEPAIDEVGTGIDRIRQMDPSFDENRFNDSVMDTFFKIQGAWMNRDLASVSLCLTDEMKRILQIDLDRLLQDKQTNRLENIAVRNVEIVEVWQESGQDYITSSIYANLLDYTIDDVTGALVNGSKTEPVKFEEFWTFTRPVGNNQWRLSAISQKQ